MQEIRLSINPTYFCNFRCSFCYLSNEQLSTPQFINSDSLLRKMEEVACHRHIKHVDLYGGEISIVPDEILKSIMQAIRLFYDGQINVITNYSQPNPLHERDDVSLSISWDYIARERYRFVYDRMLKLKKDFSILVLASEELISLTNNQLDDMIELLNRLPHLVSVEIKPFSDNRHHGQAVSNSDFENWIMKWLERRSQFNFQFINEASIRRSLLGQYSAWSDDHLYITPQGRFAVLEFDESLKEYFLDFDDFKFYENWVAKERAKVISNPFCSKCEYLGHCLSEHLQEVKGLDKSCNGFKGLLDWYRGTWDFKQEK